jgi:hypothetical protein
MMSVNKVNDPSDKKKLCQFTILNCCDVKKFLKDQWFLHLKNQKALHVKWAI